MTLGGTGNDSLPGGYGNNILTGGADSITIKNGRNKTLNLKARWGAELSTIIGCRNVATFTDNSIFGGSGGDTFICNLGDSKDTKKAPRLG